MIRLSLIIPSSLLFPQINKKVSIALDDIVYFSDTPSYLLILKQHSREDSEVKSEFIRNFPFLKKQMGEYKYDLFCSVERDNKKSLAKLY